MNLQAESLFENQKKVLLEASGRVDAISYVIESSYARWIGSEIDFRHIVTEIKQNHIIGEFVEPYECSLQMANRWVPLEKGIYLALMVNEFFNISWKIKEEFFGEPHRMLLSFHYEEAEERCYIEFFHSALTKYLDSKDEKEDLISILLLRTLGELQLRGTLQLPTLQEESITITIPSNHSAVEKGRLNSPVPTLLE